jgi:hypothetical protein
MKCLQPSNFRTFSIFVGNFCPPRSGFANFNADQDPDDQNQYGSMRIRIQMQNIVPNLRTIGKAVECTVILHVRGVQGLVVDV